MDLRAVCFVRAIVFYVRDFCAERRSALMREKIDDFFFWKKDEIFFMRFLFSWGKKQFWAVEAFGGEKNESDTPFD